ncbi:hypothetical protein [Jannaschia marina]|uniref:hypothetical protein n=1 Tax=Jannaschia marina TaxID=2741674 RepID=UPI0015CC858D|nr:hypothetical protein [Jannaschia marina]
MGDGEPLIEGDHIFAADARFGGLIAGSARVAEGVAVTLDGMVGGDLRIEAGASATVNGMVGGDLHVAPGGTLHLSGMVGGRVVDRGGASASDG